MTASYRRELHLTCDNPTCANGQPFEESFDDMDAYPKIASPTHLKRIAKQKGWWQDRAKLWYCPICAKCDQNHIKSNPVCLPEL